MVIQLAHAANAQDPIEVIGLFHSDLQPRTKHPGGTLLEVFEAE